MNQPVPENESNALQAEKNSTESGSIVCPEKSMGKYQSALPNLKRKRALPLIVYLDLTSTLFKPKSGEARPQVVEFLNALHEHNLPVRLYTNNNDTSYHYRAQSYLQKHNCKMKLPISRFDDSGYESRTAWRIRLPWVGVVRETNEDFLEKQLSKYLLDSSELRKAILVDDDCGCWLRNFGRFIPSLKYNDEVKLPTIGKPHIKTGYGSTGNISNCMDDWNTGLMGRILPALLAHLDDAISEDVKAERTNAIELASKIGAEINTSEAANYVTYVIEPLKGEEGEKLWHSTRLAFPGCSMEVLLQCLSFNFARGMEGISENKFFYCSSPRLY